MNGSQQAQHARIRDLVDALLLRVLQARQHHVRFQQHAFEQHALCVDLVEHRTKDLLGDRLAPGQRMPAIYQNFRLDDRHQADLLAQRRVARERMRIGENAATGRKPGIHRDHGAPLGEPRAETRVTGETLTQTVETFGDLFPGVARQRVCAGVDLDAGHDACLGEGRRASR